MSNELKVLKELLKQAETEKKRLAEEYEREVEPLRQTICALKLQISNAEFGVEIGSIVLSGGTAYKVTVVETKWDGKPWLIGNPRRKDGTWGTAKRHLYDNWQVDILAKERTE